MTLAPLEERVRRLEDIHSIANLKATYLDGADGGWSFNPISSNPDQVAPLFAPDGVWYSDSQGGIAGQDAIRRVWGSFSRTMPFGYHVITNPKIEVDGDTGRGAWHLMFRGIDAAGTEVWAAGIYDDEFVRTDQGWRIARVQARIVFLGPYGQGWKALMQSTSPEERPAYWPEMRENPTGGVQ